MRTNKIEVEIEGMSPLLMHNMGAKALESMSEKVKREKITHTPEEDAEDAVYRTESGELFIPARALKRCLVNASSWYKVGRKSAKQFIAGCVRINPEELTLGTSDYEIDGQPVVIQRARIVRYRPRLDKWKVTFEIHYDTKYWKGHEDTLYEILEEAGVRVGLLDYRPQKGGDYGTFKITKWHVMNGKNKT